MRAASAAGINPRVRASAASISARNARSSWRRRSVRARAQRQAQPLIAAREQRCQQRDGPVCVVVQAGEKPPPCRIVRRGGRQRGADGLQVERRRVIDEIRQRAQSRGDRRLARECRRERVDREHAQPGRLREQLPVAALVLCQCRQRQPAGGDRVRLRRIEGRGGVGVAQRAQDALAHFGCGLARERHGDDALGTIDVRQQREVALDQEPGLSRARRRLHEERLPDVERGVARRRVLALASDVGAVVSHRRFRHRCGGPSLPRHRRATESGTAPAGRSARSFAHRAAPRARHRARSPSPAHRIAAPSRASMSAQVAIAALRSPAAVFSVRPCVGVGGESLDGDFPGLHLRVDGRAHRGRIRHRPQRQRIQADLRSGRPRRKPLGRVDGASGLVVDDRDAAIGQRVDAIDAHGNADAPERQRHGHFGRTHDKWRPRALDGVEPRPDGVGEPLRLACRDGGRQRLPAHAVELGSRQRHRLARSGRRAARRPSRPASRGRRCLPTARPARRGAASRAPAASGHRRAPARCRRASDTERTPGTDSCSGFR